MHVLTHLNTCLMFIWLCFILVWLFLCSNSIFFNQKNPSLCVRKAYSITWKSKKLSCAQSPLPTETTCNLNEYARTTNLDIKNIMHSLRTFFFLLLQYSFLLRKIKENLACIWFGCDVVFLLRSKYFSCEQSF